jgi:hypothetical protein
MERLTPSHEKLETPKSRDQKIGETALEENFKTEQVRTWAERYVSTEKSYARHRKHVVSLDYEDLEEWESRAKLSYENMKDAEKSAKFRSRYERDSTERIGTLDPDESIEADSGKFYLRRQRALVKAIEMSNESNKEKDILAGEELYRFVNEHLYYEHDYDTRSMDPGYYQSRRRAAHNALINHLNHMNDLCRKYGVTPFTFRNFEDNDFTYYPDMDTGGHTNARAEYDRSTVEAYCRNAFSSSYEKAEKDNH